MKSVPYHIIGIDGRRCAGQQYWLGNVALGSSTAAPAKESRGGYTPHNGREGGRLARRFRANSSRTHPQQKQQAISPSDRGKLGHRPAGGGVIFCPALQRA